MNNTLRLGTLKAIPFFSQKPTGNIDGEVQW